MTKKFTVTWSHNSTCISSHIEDNGCQHIGVTTSTCQGHVSFPVTWPFDSPRAISYRCSIVTESLSPTIFEIMGIFYIWVTTLTFLGHVMSSVTWPFDSPGAICYRCSIVTESLSPTIFEIMDIFLYLGHDLDLSMSHDVIGHVTNRSAMCHFLLVSHCNRTSISNRFRDIRPPKPVRTHRHTHRRERERTLLSHVNN